MNAGLANFQTVRMERRRNLGLREREIRCVAQLEIRELEEVVCCANVARVAACEGGDYSGLHVRTDEARQHQRRRLAHTASATFPNNAVIIPPKVRRHGNEVPTIYARGRGQQRAHGRRFPAPSCSSSLRAHRRLCGAGDER
jgi:hypothetical protein